MDAQLNSDDSVLAVQIDTRTMTLKWETPYWPSPKQQSRLISPTKSLDTVSRHPRKTRKEPKHRKQQINSTPNHSKAPFKDVVRSKASIVHDEPLDDENQKDLVTELSTFLGIENAVIPHSWKGNSDPFDSFPIPLTARIFELIRFDQYWIHEVTKVLSRYLGPANRAFIPSWWPKYSSVFSCSEIPILGYLARVAAMVGTMFGREEYTMRAAAFRTQAMKRLRDRLDESDRTLVYHARTAHCITSLIIAEQAVDNHDVARMHLSMLKQLVEDPFFGQAIDFKTLFLILFLDIQSSNLLWTHTVLDHSEGGWMERHFWASWSQAEASLPSMTQLARKHLDPCLELSDMGSWFAQIREQYMLMQFLLERRIDTVLDVALVSTGMNDWFSIKTRMTFLVGRANNRFVSSWDELNLLQQETQKDSESKESDRQSKLKLCTTLLALIGAIIYSRRFVNVDAVPARLCGCGNIHKVPVGSVPFEKVRTLVEVLDSCSLPRDMSKYANLRLWVLFVVVQHVQYVSQYCRNQRRSKEERWALREFGRQLRSIGISSWPECESILTGLLYYPNIETVPASDWFEKVLNSSEALEKPRDAPMAVKRWVEVDAKAIVRK
jgi:hypothetical protein